MNITLQVRNSISKLNCPQRSIQSNDNTQFNDQFFMKSGKGIFYNNNNINNNENNGKTFMISNNKNLNNTKNIRQQQYTIPRSSSYEYDDYPQQQLQECLISTKLNSIQFSSKSPILTKTPLQKPINYLTKKSIQLKQPSSILSKQSYSVEHTSKNQITLPKIVTKNPAPVVPLKKTTKRKKVKRNKLSEIKENIQSMPEIYIDTERQEEYDPNFIIRQEDL